MHVGLNLVFLVPGETGGMETYARELIAALCDDNKIQLTAFLSREAAADTSAPWAQVRCVTVPVHARRRAEWVRGEQQLLPRLARRERVDLVHSLASTAPLWGRFRRVVTIHDLIYRIYPDAHSGLRAKAMGVLVPLAARRSDRIIVPSVSTQNDLTSLLRVSAAKIDVVPEGVRVPTQPRTGGRNTLRDRLGIGARPVVLTLSAKRPHKNITRLLEAIALIPSERRPVLLLPGYATPWENALQQRATELDLNADTRFLGWVDQEELEQLYDVASCFVFPSLYEGFGLPVLEAMARGVPVACSDRGSLPEVTAGAALLFDPEQPAAIAEAIDVLLRNPTEAGRLVTLGRARVETLTWKRTALATIGVYARTLNSA